MKYNVRNMANKSPPTTPMPQLERISKPMPRPNAIGSMPITLAMEVMRIGRNFFCEARSIAKIGRDQSYVANIIGMVQISPKIIHAVIRGDYPKTLTLATLKRKLPDLWSEQEAMLLGEN